MFAGVAALSASVLALAALGLKGWRDHAQALALRGRMLDDCASALAQARISAGPDGFPVLTGRLDDGRAARVELIADTLVTRRLPQLWLRLTIQDPSPRRDFSIGALARPTGAEFYSLVAGLPDRLEWTGDMPLVVKGRGVSRTIERTGAPVFADLFSDSRLKEAAVTPGGSRVVRQACEGDRASHLLLRQVRFGINGVQREVLRHAIGDAMALERAIVAEEREQEAA